MTILSGLDKLIASVAGPLLFSRSQLSRVAGGVIDPSTGQQVAVNQYYSVEALETDWNQFHRAQLGIPSSDKKILIIASGLEIMPRPGDRVVIDQWLWEIVEASRDPARALYSCQARSLGPTNPVTIITHAGRLRRAELSADMTKVYFDHAGTLRRSILASEFRSQNAVDHAGQLRRAILDSEFDVIEILDPISLDHSVTLGRAGLTSLLITASGIYHAGALSRAGMSAVFALPLAMDHAGALRRAGLNAFVNANETRTLEHSGLLARSGLAAGMTLAGALEHAGTLARVSSVATFGTQAGLSHAGTLRRASQTAEFGAAVAVSGQMTLGRCQPSGEIQNAVTVQSEGILGRVTQSVTLAAPGAVDHAGLLRRSNLLAEMIGVPSLSHAGTLARAGLSSGMVSALALSHAGALSRGSLSADMELEAGGPIARTTPAYATSNNTVTGAGTFPPPSGTSAGDLLIAFIFDFVSSATITPPSGWTMIGTQISSGSLFTAIAIYKIATGSEPGSYSYGVSGGDFPCVLCARYTGVDTSDPIGAFANNTGSVATRTIPSLTLDEANSRIVAFSGCQNEAGVVGVPAGMTGRVDVFGVTGIYDEAVAATGATGTRTHTAGAAVPWLTWNVALNGAPV